MSIFSFEHDSREVVLVVLQSVYIVVQKVEESCLQLGTVLVDLRFVISELNVFGAST